VPPPEIACIEINDRDLPVRGGGSGAVVCKTTAGGELRLEYTRDGLSFEVQSSARPRFTCCTGSLAERIGVVDVDVDGAAPRWPTRISQRPAMPE
jgi:hypothetical protein